MAKGRLKNIIGGIKTAITNIIKPPQTEGQTTTDSSGTASVWTKDYVGGGAETTTTSTRGGVTTTTVETDRTSGGGYITPTTTTTVTSPSREVISQQTTTAQPSYYDVKTVTDLRELSSQQQQFYQGLVNKGMDVEEANTKLNKSISDYQKNYYEQQGYKVIETNGQLQLQRETPRVEPTYNYPDSKYVGSGIESYKDIKALTKQSNEVSSRLNFLGNELKIYENAWINKDTQEWTGTQEAYNAYLKLYDKYNDTLAKYKSLGATVNEEGMISSPTVTRGTMFLTKEYPIETFSKSQLYGALGYAASIPTLAGTTMEATFEQGSRMLGLKDTGLFQINTPVKTLSYDYTTTRQGTMMYDNFGKPIVYETKKGTYEQPARTYNIITPSQIGFLGRAAPYMNPYGGYLFKLEAGSTLGGFVVKEKSLVRGATSYFKTYPIEATFAGGMALYGIGKSIYNFAKPYTTITALRKPMQQNFIEIQQGGRSGYKIFGEITPPRRVVTTSRFREFFGMKPKIKPYTIPAKTFTFYTPYKVKVGTTKPFLTSLQVSGRKFQTVSMIGGKSAPTTLEQWNTLSKTEKDMWKKLAEKITGKKIDIKGVYMVIRDNVELARSITANAPIFRISKTGNIINIKTPYKEGFKGFKPQVDFVGSVSGTTPLGSSPYWEKFDIKTIFGTSGKPYLKGKLFKEVVRGGEINIIRTSGGGTKTPFSQTFQIQTQVQPLVKPIIKTPPFQNVVTKIKPIADIGTPLMVGGTGLKVLPQPSRFFEILIDVNRLPTNIKYSGALGGLTTWLSTSQTIKPIELIKPIEVTTTKQTSVLVPISMFGLTLLVTSKYKSAMGQPQPQISLQKQPQPQIQPQVPIVIQSQPSILKIRQPQLLKQPQGYKQVPRLKQPRLKQPRLKQPRLKQPELFKPQKKGKQIIEFFKTSPSTKNIFESFLKRRGKDISLGKFGDIGSAKTKFLKEVKTTLGASGFITKNKEVVPLKELNLGYEFTPSKKQPLFRAVQRRGLRLSSRGEVSEIMGSKRNKPKKIGSKVKWL